RERVRGLVESGRYAELGLRPPIRTAASESCAAEAEALIRRLNFLHLADRHFVTLSQGEQQIVLLARALMAEPMLIILDEPCAGLDPVARERFLETLTRVLEDPQHRPPATVLVTHHLEEVLPPMTNLLLLKDGRIHSRGSAESCLTEERIEAVYGRRPRAIRVVDQRHWPIWS
ncbi:MAG: ATP-binding cassette domain-containing protein, partial [Planctomycetota bacterium]